MKAAQLEWNYNWSQLNEQKISLPLTFDERGHTSRHQRVLKKHVVDLEKRAQTMKKVNDELTSRVLKLEEEIRILQNANTREHISEKPERILGNEISKYIQSHQLNEVNENNNIPLADDNRSFEERVSKLELEQKTNDDSIFNLSKQFSNFDKLHMSILELLENVENIENKVDKGFPEFRKEISKLEVQMSEAISEVALLKEDQTNTRQSVKAISVSVSNLKDKEDMDRLQLEEVCDKIEHLHKSSSIQTSKLHDHILKVGTLLTTWILFKMYF